MSLNTIKLDAQQLADLYTNHLVESHLVIATQSSAEGGERRAYSPENVKTSAESGERRANSPERRTENEEQVVGNVKSKTAEKRGPGFLGKNGKKILVLVSHDSVPYLPDHELNFLTTILAACKLSMADIAIANLQSMDNDDAAALISTEGKSILLFGLEPSHINLPINFPQYQLQQFDKRTYLHAPTLSELENNTDLKKQLWASLKKLFGL